MDDRTLTLFKAAKALVSYIDGEYVFDRASDMGCGGVDMHQSEAFYNLIADARKAIMEFERNVETAG